MPETYKIEDVLGKEEWESNYGPMFSYRLLLSGEGEVSINQKPTSPPPQVGAEIYGEITANSHGKKIKRIDPNFASTSGSGGSAPRPSGGMTPQREARIERMAHHKVAVQLVELALTAGILTPKDINSSEHLVNVVATLSDLLAADLP